MCVRGGKEEYEHTSVKGFRYRTRPLGWYVKQWNEKKEDVLFYSLMWTQVYFKWKPDFTTSNQKTFGRIDFVILQQAP